MRIASLVLFLAVALRASPQIPPGYYDPAAGLAGSALKTALHNIINDHTSVSYNSLPDYFETTDKKANGQVWDMYSDVPGSTPPYTYNFTSGDQCGSYSAEGDCWNREHSWPASWFNDQTPTYSDMFHIYPTDGKVNGQRSNYPFGEVGNATWTSENGSKLGICGYPGYTGTVFEPIDPYKGDFARTYFYMTTRYYSEDGGWASNVAVNKSELRAWLLEMLMQWHEDDPVSQKETDRNDAVYDIQHNRNPFIDHPEYVDLIWGPAAVSEKSQSPAIISVFPNPVSDRCYVDVENLGFNGDYIIHIITILGQKVFSEYVPFHYGYTVIDLSKLTPGCYFLTVADQNGIVAGAGKILKQ